MNSKGIVFAWSAVTEMDSMMSMLSSALKNDLRSVMVLLFAICAYHFSTQWSDVLELYGLQLGGAARLARVTKSTGRNHYGQWA